MAYNERMVICMTDKKINASDYVDFNNLIQEDTFYSLDGRVRIMIETSEFDKYIETYTDRKNGDVELTIYLTFRRICCNSLSRICF